MHFFNHFQLFYPLFITKTYAHDICCVMCTSWGVGPGCIITMYTICPSSRLIPKGYSTIFLLFFSTTRCVFIAGCMAWHNMYIHVIQAQKSVQKYSDFMESWQKRTLAILFANKVVT